MQRITLYRATCFGKPIAPWRSNRDHAREDLKERGLGSYDEWGHFWITVPGDMQKRHEVQSIAA